MREEEKSATEEPATKKLLNLKLSNVKSAPRAAAATAISTAQRMKDALAYFPQMVRLCANLLMDERVSKTEKALFASALLYAVTPFDFLPDFIPFVGQIDDAYLVALTLLRLVNRTDAAVVREHWRGKGDIVELAESVASIAPALMPKRVGRVLSSNIDFAPLIKRGRLMMQGRGKSLLVDSENNDDTKKPLVRVVEATDK